VGAVMTNITNDVEAIREFISYGIVTIVGDLLKIGFIIPVNMFTIVVLPLPTEPVMPITWPGLISILISSRASLSEAG
ncbi:unnamed protein product, partial [marine sediment metagenome]